MIHIQYIKNEASHCKKTNADDVYIMHLSMYNRRFLAGKIL